MDIKTVFISQPMSGIPEEEVEAARDHAIQFLSSVYPGCEILSTYFRGPIIPENPLECLGESIKKLQKADAIYMCPGWEKARGCTIEYMCALKYGKAVIYAGNFTNSFELIGSFPYMLSGDYKDRFIAEYNQLSIRLRGIERLLADTYDDNVESEMICPGIDLVKKQYDVMLQYREILEERARIENINLNVLERENTQ